MKKYWLEHSLYASEEEMILDNNNSNLSVIDRNEILSKIPSVENKDVIEVGAGIGRLSKCIAPLCKSLKVVDFIEKFIEKNKEENGRFLNMQFECNDAVAMKEDEFKYDMVITNWLLMYLNDSECYEFIKKCLTWLRIGGFIFIRESCFHKSGNINRNYNPTYYRSPKFYSELFEKINYLQYRYKFINHGSIKCYEEIKNNKHQYFWLLQKVIIDYD